MNENIQIDKEFKDLISPLSNDEFEQLKSNIILFVKNWNKIIFTK